MTSRGLDRKIRELETKVRIQESTIEDAKAARDAALAELGIKRSEIEEWEKNRCEHCGSNRIIDNCPSCGAPQCCQSCCAVTTVEIERDAAREACLGILLLIDTDGALVEGVRSAHEIIEDARKIVGTMYQP